MEQPINRRILIVDDNDAIQSDFRKILGTSSSPSLGSARSAFLGTPEETKSETAFELAMASQGEQGIKMALQARRTGNPFALAFVDVRMPPGLDGVDTIERLWQIQPDLQVVICTAFADYSFEEIIDRLGSSDNLLILKKPFEPVEVRQMASALTNKWNMRRQEHERMVQLREAEREAREFALSLAETNRALEDASNAAEAASRAKSNFLANMSHEIRTPMNAILGYLDLLFESIETTAEQEEYVRTVRRSGRHLLTIVDDVLDISRIEAGKLTLVNDLASPAELGRDVISICQSNAAIKGLRLTMEVLPDVPETIRTDPNRLRQILLNLVGNAIKFTSSGFVRLQLDLDRDEAGERLRFRVRDSGPGIGAKDRESLFDAFTQVDSSTTRGAGGTGLGLAICKRLAQALGGEVLVESELGSGSCFDLVLQLDTTEEPIDGRPPAPVPAAPRASAAARPLEPEELHGSVLLVEDVAVNQLLMQTMLGKAGARVTLADNGRAACEAVRAAEAEGAPFDLILMDMQMPVMDGYEATRELRAGGLQTPIVALTAHAMTTDRDRCLEAGCTDYITKPVDRAHLLETCARLLAESPPPALPAAPPKEAPRDEASRPREAG